MFPPSDAPFWFRRRVVAISASWPALLEGGKSLAPRSNLPLGGKASARPPPPLPPWLVERLGGCSGMGGRLHSPRRSSITSRRPCLACPL
eukprot:scaffold302938_cov21-Tisochrysis_lutea.AAC.2